MTRFLRNNTLTGTAYLLAAAVVCAMWVWGAESEHTSFNGDFRSTLSDLIYGRAHKPFVSRTLVPTLTILLHEAIPRNVRESVRHELYGINKVRKEMTRLGWEEEFLTEYLVALALALGFFFVFPFLVRAFWKTLYESPPEVTNVVPLLVLAALPPFFSMGTHYIYDFPAITLFTAALVYIVKREWLAAHLLFFIGCLNKETILMIPVALTLLAGGDRRSVARHVIIQAVIFLSVRIFLGFRFAQNPGTVVEFYLHGNIHQMLLGYDVTGLLAASIILFLLFYRYNSKPETLRRLFLLVIPFLGFMLLFGRVNEPRALYEVLPIVMFVVLHTLFFDLLKIPFSPKRQPAVSP